MEELIILGGGPAGLMAAISAARRGITPLILEKNVLLGRKILVSGNGRCNITNSNLNLNNYNGDKPFLEKIFSCFSDKELTNFFDELGVRLKEETFNRVIPVTEQAGTILDALNDELEHLKVQTIVGEEIINAVKTKNGFKVETKKGTYETKELVIALGGMSYPKLGATKKGFELAQGFGHKITAPLPALAPVELNGNWFRALQGLRIEAEINVKSKGKVRSFIGELLFTKYGISGPVALDASGEISRTVGEKTTNVWINLVPSYEDFLETFINNIWEKRKDKTASASLSGVLPKKVAKTVLEEAKIDSEKESGKLSSEEKENIFKILKAFPISIKAVKSFNESMVTSGGVATSEIDPATMESKLVKGLFFAGEVMDIDGISGGYNMQLAFSTGWIAGGASTKL